MRTSTMFQKNQTRYTFKSLEKYGPVSVIFGLENLQRALYVPCSDNIVGWVTGHPAH